MEYLNLKKKVNNYYAILSNTQTYRQQWKDGLKDDIVTMLTEISSAVGLKGTIRTPDKVGNAEAIIFAMGKEASGIYTRIDDDTNKPLIKDFGSLVYQQLFNGKIQVLVFLPFIEGYGNPHPPKMVAIYRPEEVKKAYIERHIEEFVRMLTEWEDFDDDAPAPIGFQLPQLVIPSDNDEGK